MDAYNRGYNAGIGNNSVGLGVNGAIGNATIGATSLNLGQTGGVRNDQAASFFAISYSFGGTAPAGLANQTVISYRGTDDPSVDATNGYGVALGMDRLILPVSRGWPSARTSK
jgi:hypothetical protein